MRPEQSKPADVVPPRRYAVPIAAAAVATTESVVVAPAARVPMVVSGTGAGEPAGAGSRPVAPAPRPPNAAPSRRASSSPCRAPGVSSRQRASAASENTESGPTWYPAPADHDPQRSFAALVANPPPMPPTT